MVSTGNGKLIAELGWDIELVRNIVEVGVILDLHIVPGDGVRWRAFPQDRIVSGIFCNPLEPSEASLRPSSAIYGKPLDDT